MAGTESDGIEHNPDSRDHFEVLGLPRKLGVDQEALSRAYFALSRRYHPDFHQSAAPADRVANLRRSAAVNEAYKTLRDPVARGRWWLGANGRKLGSRPEVPQDLAMLVFEVQEVLESYRDDPESADGDLAGRREEVAAEQRRRFDALTANFAKWDERGEEPDEVLLDELQSLLAELSYLNTLVRDIERTVETGEAR